MLPTSINEECIQKWDSREGTFPTNSEPLYLILLTGWEISVVIQAFWKTICSCSETHVQLLAEDHDNCVNMCQDFLKRWNVNQQTLARILWHTNQGCKYIYKHRSSCYAPLMVVKTLCYCRYMLNENYKLQILHILGMHKEYKHKTLNGNCSMERQTKHVVQKQLSGN